MRKEENAYQSWLLGEILLFGLLGATLAFFVAYPSLRPTFDLPQVRLVLDTTVALAAVLVAVLAGIRFSVDGRRLDLLLRSGSGPRRPRASQARDLGAAVGACPRGGPDRSGGLRAAAHHGPSSG